MRIALIVIGIILLGLGVWVALGDAHYNDTSTKAQLGPLKVEATSQKPVPAPIGYAGIVIGGVLIVAGALKKK
ncbi:MAG TPA: hypothetical protein VJ722_12355 [Rhodanobacteraceae bacterium]|jgi:uncharacterized membrane protein|nr:MAG: hypothetical protein OJF61_002414 [Rhodanobacteraceae bacterium]HJU27461.1 hypothetical protein [Rhodanobacteraceae bacterium]